MNVRVLGCVVSFSVTVAAASGAGCSSASQRSGFDPTVETSPTTGADSGAGFKNGPPGKGSPCAVNNVSTELDKDTDGDGYPLRDDCNECDPNINVGAFDVAGNGIDEDCNGKVDDEPVDCDKNLVISPDAFEGANAIGLCKKATNDKMWGVVEATWVKPDGSPQSDAIGHGVLPKFGVNAAQTGQRVLAISSGIARAPSDPGYQPGVSHDKRYSSGTPAGYPKESPSCAGKTTGSFGGSNDGAGLKVKIRVPSNAKSFKYQQNFFTYEFPNFICQRYNDFFVTIMDPKPASLPDGNIAFDQDGNPISVNNSFLQVCSPQTTRDGKQFGCPLGASTLEGTGFESHAATGWLTTTAPVDALRGKEMTLMWTIWDQGDHAYDSSALIDDFEWSVEPANGTQTLPSPPK